MREQLVQAIRERTGLGEAMAEQVVTVVIDQLRMQLPPQIAPMLATLLGGNAESGAPAAAEGDTPAIPDVGGMLGGLFGPRGT